MSDLVIFRMDAVYTGSIAKLGLIVPAEAHSLGLTPIRLLASRADWEPGGDPDAADQLADTIHAVVDRFRAYLLSSWDNSAAPLF